MTKNFSSKYNPSQKFNGRGTNRNPAGRFEKYEYISEPGETYERESIHGTKYFEDTSRSVITLNDSPDVGADASLNIYRGCEHGCSYCYARQTHEYLGLSAGVDFETKIYIKHDAPNPLRKELNSKRWVPKVIMLSGNTDSYQPIEKKLELTRKCLQVLHEFHNPVNITTKNKLVTRDIDILSEMAKFNTISVTISVTSLDNRLASVMEPQTSKPNLKFDAMQQLSDAGIPVGVNIAPVIPGLTDHEIPEIIGKAVNSGAEFAGYIMLRLPFGIKELFLNWLETYFPDRKQKVVNKLQELFDGKLYDSTFNIRGRGKGVLADQIRSTFNISCRKAGINTEHVNLSVEHFTRQGGDQLSFDLK